MNALAAVIPALITTFTGAVSVPVFDGPLLQAAADQQFVLVGGTGEDEHAADIRVDWSHMGPGTWRDETGDVICSAWAVNDSTDIAACRVAAGALAVACADAIAGDRTLGGLLIQPGASVSGFQYHPRQTPNGAVVRVLFTVSYTALLT